MFAVRRSSSLWRTAQLATTSSSTSTIPLRAFHASRTAYEVDEGSTKDVDEGRTTNIDEHVDEEILSNVKSHLMQAMRNKDKFAATVYRSVLSEQQYAVKDAQMQGLKSARVVMDTGISNILQKALQSRRESSSLYRKAKPAREDLARQEDREASLIRAFLPEQMSSQELEGIVRNVVKEKKEKEGMKKVIKAVREQVHPSRASGPAIASAVKKAMEQ